MPLTRDHSPVSPATTDRDRALNDVFTTALEGGIGYWSRCSRYHWQVTGSDAVEAADFIAVIHEMGDEDDEDAAPVHVVDASVIRKGIRLAHARGGWVDYQARALRDLTFGKYDEVDFDAITADIIVQHGLFGEERYS
jgi:hypothetical protein